MFILQLVSIMYLILNVLSESLDSLIGIDKTITYMRSLLLYLNLIGLCIYVYYCNDIALSVYTIFSSQ